MNKQLRETGDNNGLVIIIGKFLYTHVYPKIFTDTGNKAWVVFFQGISVFTMMRL